MYKYKIVSKHVYPPGRTKEDTRIFEGDSLLGALETWSDPKLIPDRIGAQGCPLQVFCEGQELSFEEFQQRLFKEIKVELSRRIERGIFPGFKWIETSYSSGVVKDDTRGYRSYSILHPFLLSFFTQETLEELISFLMDIKGELIERGFRSAPYEVEETIEEIKDLIYRKESGDKAKFFYSFQGKEVRVEV